MLPLNASSPEIATEPGHGGHGFGPTSSRLPVIARRSAKLSRREIGNTTRLAAAIAGENRRLGDTTYFGPAVKAGLGSTPFILIGDKSEIPLMAVGGDDTLEYRIALLANEGDLIVFAGQRNPDFESYLCGLLGLPALNVLEVRAESPEPRSPTAQRCMDDAALSERLARHVRAGGGATLMPHFTTGSTWALGKHLHERTGQPVFVAGPPPNLSKKVNDKIWFANVAARLFGDHAIPHKLTAFGPAALTGHVRKLARKCEKIVVKLPHSAGSAGNLPIRCDTILNLGTKALRQHLIDRFSAAGWPEHYPLLVEVWDCNVLASPSIQVWIPDRAEGEPVIEGIYDQLLTGEEGQFIGAAPAELEPSWDQRICRDAMQLALLFQHLGYFGRCSFDTVIAGDSMHDAELHWIECNGRWGGVSLPMTFLNRIFGAQAIPAYVIIQRSQIAVPPLPFSEALRRLGDDIYRPGGRPQGIIMVTPGYYETGTGLHFISMDRTVDKALGRADATIVRLHGEAIIPP